jgi:hypothetical protein
MHLLMKSFIQIFCTISLKISGRAAVLIEEPPCPNISLMNPVHTFPFSFSTVHFYICLSISRPSKKFLSFRCPHQTPVPTHIFSTRHTTRSAHLIHTHFTTLISGEEHKSCMYSIHSFLHPLVTSTLSGPNILLSTLFLKYIQPTFSS